MKVKFDSLFNMQATLSKMFWDMCKGGKIDLSKKGEFDLYNEEYKSEFDAFKSFILSQDESFFAHLNYGTVFTSKLFVINEQNNTIYNTEQFETLNRNWY